MATLDPLREALEILPPGDVPPAFQAIVESGLIHVWRSFSGSDAGGMTPRKLANRTEAMRWDPPRLRFTIERHGAAALGSSRAELQHWEADLARRTATLTGSGQRQIAPTAPRLNVKPLAAEIAGIVLEGREDPRVRRRGGGYVRIVLGEVIPTTVQQTTTGRRRRFAAELERLIAPAGWKRKDAGSHLVFELPDPPA